MKTIPLTRGQVALVDDEDFERISAHKWYAAWVPYVRAFRATRCSSREANNKQRRIFMHREIVGAKSGEEVDHVNHDMLDNRRANLRVCSTAENQHNQRKHIDNTSGFKGVSWHKSGQKWRATIQFNGKNHHIGYFATPEQASRAYDAAAMDHFGQFALTNEFSGDNPGTSREER